MTFIPIPQAVEVAVHWSIGGQDVVCTFGVKFPVAITLALLQAAADAMATWATGNLVSRISQQAIFSNAVATDQSSSSGGTALSLINTGTPGGIVSDALPNNVSLAISNLTDLRGRSYRGRNFVPGVPKNKQDSPSTVLSAWVTSLLVDWTNINTALAGSTGVHAVLSRYHDNAPRGTGVATPVTGYRSNVVIDGQRRRLLGRGT